MSVYPEQGVAEGLETTQYAGFWKRFAAYLIDVVLLAIVVFPLVIIGMGPDAFDPSAAVTPAMGRMFGVQIVAVVIEWLYFAGMESSAGQATLGKRALGIKVTDMSGNRITFGKATGRFFGKILSSLILLIGFLMAAFTQKKQALHDLLAGTLVVNRR
jgi:uncharacterized RDD family membrane protein YckC